MATNQLQGGGFQDAEGNLLALGTLKMQLNQDAVTGTGVQICAGVTITIKLDSSGNIATSPTQSVWPNDQLTPANTYYTITGYNANGQLCWGPNNNQVLSSPSPFIVSAWVPNLLQVFNPNVQYIVLTGSTPTVSAGQLGIASSTAATATSGAATLPGNPLGFLVLNLGGVIIKVPYYSN